MNKTNSSYFTFNVNNSALLVGQTGTGKTEFVRSLMRRYESAFAPDEMKYVVFDMKQCEFNPTHDGGAKQEYLYCDIVTRPDSAFEILEGLAKQSHERAQQTKPQPFIFIYIEESDISCVNQDRFDAAVTTINQNAKQANMKLIYSTSAPREIAVSKKLLTSFELVLAGTLSSEADANYLAIPYEPSLQKYEFIVMERS